MHHFDSSHVRLQVYDVDQSDPTYAAEMPTYEIVHDPTPSAGAGRLLPKQASKGSVYGFEEEELKAAGGSQDDKPDNYLELAASELNKRRKSRK